MLKVQNLHKDFGGASKVKAVDGVNFELATGTMAAIIGKSGSGKSTLLALLGALDSPTSGQITVDDQEVTKLGERKLLDYRRGTVGFVFQSYNLVPNLSALDNVMLPMEFAGIGGTKRRQRAEHLLKQVGLTGDKLRRPPGKLSGGEQQRVAIARALANKPKLVLADEPTGNLDTQTSQTIVDLLRSLAKAEQTTIIVVTHDPDIANHAAKVFHMRDGQLTVG
jgi:putative ABC transport system ATP-binding protein